MMCAALCARTQTLPGDHVRPLQQLLPPEVVGAVKQSVQQSAEALDRLSSLADTLGVPPLLRPFDVIRPVISDALRTPPAPADQVRAARPPRPAPPPGSEGVSVGVRAQAAADIELLVSDICRWMQARRPLARPALAQRSCPH